MEINTYLSEIFLNMPSVQYSRNTDQQVRFWKQFYQFVASSKTPLQQRQIQSWSKGLTKKKKATGVKGTRNQLDVSVLISDKTDNNPKLVKRNRGLFIMTKRTSQQEVITVLNTFSLNTGKPLHSLNKQERGDRDITTNTSELHKSSGHAINLGRFLVVKSICHSYRRPKFSS